MAGLIPQEILEEILNRIDIVELISGYIPLKRAGRNFKALCPFHHEKTPSFMVSPERQIYHCFGCGISGNAFKFLMQYERLEFIEAVKTLAKKAGVVLPEAKDSQSTGMVMQIYHINELAANFYHHLLNSEEAKAAKIYLLKRALKEETLRLFKLGYAPEGWEALMGYLRAKNISLSLLEKAGLIIPKEGGGYYDRFRHRIIFPIFDIKTRVIGFGARVLDNSLPKYINSPETIIYNKGKNLYGLNLTKDSIRQDDYVVIVEGYLDCIIPYQEGLNNIVASLGTALTHDQVRLLKRYTHNVILVYDADKAGQLATLRSLDIFIEEEMNVRVVSLPEGFDPDLYVRRFGIEKFKEKLNRAESLFDYKLKVLKSRYDPLSIEGKTGISSEMLPTINKFKNAILKSEYIRRLAEELNVEEDALWQEIKRIKLRSYPQVEPKIEKKPININPTERLLMRLMLEENALIEYVRNNLEPADFQDDRVSRIVAIMFELIEQGKTIEPRYLINYLNEDEVSRIICESSFLPDVSSEKKQEILEDCIKRLKNQRLRLKRQFLHDQIKKAQDLHDEQTLKRLIQEFDQLIKKG
ncbi:MAG: DNA primase [Candidatus Omnitrophica bacterium]|nr:DNA primase [Candidatus Omnitrophota bacterium]